MSQLLILTGIIGFAMPNIQGQVTTVTQPDLGLSNLPNDNSTLSSAIKLYQEEEVTKLVLHGANVNERYEGWRTPLMIAAMGLGNNSDKGVTLRIIKFLIENGANVSKTDDADESFLHHLFSEDECLSPSDFHHFAEYLVAKNLTRLFGSAITNPFGNIASKQTPLMRAVKHIDVDNSTISLLVGNGIDIRQSDWAGCGLLYFAVAGNRSAQFLSHLVSLGADWERVNLIGETLIHVAAQHGNVAGLKYLLSLGLDPNPQEWAALIMDTPSPLYVGIMNNKVNPLEVVEVLLEHGADPGIVVSRWAHLSVAADDKDKVLQLVRQRIMELKDKHI